MQYRRPHAVVVMITSSRELDKTERQSLNDNKVSILINIKSRKTRREETFASCSARQQRRVLARVVKSFGWLDREVSTRWILVLDVLVCTLGSQQLRLPLIAAEQASTFLVAPLSPLSHVLIERAKQHAAPSIIRCALLAHEQFLKLAVYAPHPFIHWLARPIGKFNLNSTVTTAMRRDSETERWFACC